MDNIKQVVREYILREFLYGENPELLTDTTPLVTGGILDSLTTLKLQFLEEQFGIMIGPHEATMDYLDTLNDIASLVQVKKGA